LYPICGHRGKRTEHSETSRGPCCLGTHFKQLEEEHHGCTSRTHRWTGQSLSESTVILQVKFGLLGDSRKVSNSQIKVYTDKQLFARGQEDSGIRRVRGNPASGPAREEVSRRRLSPL
jgi:hypothetical protein